MKIFELKREIIVPGKIDEVFAFFAKAENLEQLTPSFLNFSIQSALPIEMKEGAEIDYRIAVRGFPLHWKTRITRWEPPFCFVDEQAKGPYRLWVHRHGFEDLGTKTRVRDHVRYSPLGGGLVNRLFVAKDLDLIFEYRHQILKLGFDSDRENEKLAVRSQAHLSSFKTADLCLTPTDQS